MLPAPSGGVHCRTRPEVQPPHADDPLLHTTWGVCCGIARIAYRERALRCVTAHYMMTRSSLCLSLFSQYFRSISLTLDLSACLVCLRRITAREPSARKSLTTARPTIYDLRIDFLLRLSSASQYREFRQIGSMAQQTRNWEQYGHFLSCCCNNSVCSLISCRDPAMYMDRTQTLHAITVTDKYRGSMTDEHACTWLSIVSATVGYFDGFDRSPPPLSTWLSIWVACLLQY
ncbi:hypothetical protein F5B21DRAFT_406872 [Xylaria acuta]|nr:hypothetical protein F5B21DRAFT_406872 [Xylaria acuta]